MKYSLKDLISKITPPDMSNYRKFIPLYIKEAQKGVNWEQWDKEVFDDYFEKAFNAVAYLGQGAFRPKHKQAIKANWMKIAPHLKAIASSQDVPLWDEYRAIKRIVIQCTEDNMQIATNRMLACLQPNLLCTEVDLKKINELYDYIITYTDTEIPKYDRNSWERASYELLKLFHTILPGKDVSEYAYMPWKLLDLFRDMEKNVLPTYWLVSSNDNIFRVADCLKENQCVDWQSSFKPKKGDIVFIYLSKPIQRICFKTIVTRTNIPRREIINDTKYWGKDHAPKDEFDPDGLHFRMQLIQESDSLGLHLSKLLQHGLKKAPQGPKKLYGEILNYILPFFDSQQNDYDEIEDNKDYYEGALKRVYVNKYERDHDARMKCIEAHGYKCSVCGMDFEKMYGELGKGFIHVHHIVPISTIGEEYKIDPVKDMVPVCPNCHAMLHRGKDGQVLSVDELKEIIKQ